MYFEVSKRLSLLPGPAATLVLCELCKLLTKWQMKRCSVNMWLFRNQVHKGTFQKTNVSPPKVVGKIFPFPKVGYVRSLEVIIHLGLWFAWVQSHFFVNILTQKRRWPVSVFPSKPPNIDWSAITCLFGLHCYSYSYSCIIHVYTYIYCMYIYIIYECTALFYII